MKSGWAVRSWSIRLSLGETPGTAPFAKLHGETLPRERKPKSLEICALLHKHIAVELKYPTKFVGFDAPHEFLVGYGLDHAENFRHLPYIASLE